MQHFGSVFYKQHNSSGLKPSFESELSCREPSRVINPLAYALLAAVPIMSLALSDVKRIANLSRLELTDEQANQTLEKLNSIFALAEQMKAVDTAGVAPLSHPIAMLSADLALRLREDVVTETDHRAQYQQPAPATQDGLYLVPKVIE